MLSFVKRKIFRYFLIGIFILLSAQQLIQFFTYQPANKNKSVGDYVGMHAVYFLLTNIQQYLSQSSASKPTICLYSTPNNIKTWKILHAIEQKQYFLPDFQVEVQSVQEIQDHEVFIEVKPQNNTECHFNGTYTFEKKIFCKDHVYYCPKSFTGTISIFHDRLL